MSVAEMLAKMEKDELLDLKISALNHLVNKEISLKEYLKNEAILNTELKKYEGEV